jgi:hypothetical protein
MEIRFILNEYEDSSCVTPINVARSIIDYAFKSCPINSDIEFIRQVSEHLNVFWKGTERELYTRKEDDE